MIDIVPQGMVHRTAPKPPDPLRPWLPRGAPFFAMIAVAVLVWLVGATTRIVCQGKLSQVHEHDIEKDVRSAGQRRDTDHENASTAWRLMQRSPAGGDVVVAA
jgi:hypothetical protein